jgi:hypothetical protein
MPDPSLHHVRQRRIRQLNPEDAEAWALLRREALEAHPLAFGASVPDNPRLLVETGLARLAPSEEAAVFGAIGDAGLVGIVGVRRETGKKERHKAFIWGMYVSAVSYEGYASSLAAATLHMLGLRRATDVVDGFQAWRAAKLPVNSTGTPSPPRLAPG